MPVIHKYRGGRAGPRWTVYLIAPIVLGIMLVAAHKNVYAIVAGILILGVSASDFSKHSTPGITS